MGRTADPISRLIKRPPKEQTVTICLDEDDFVELTFRAIGRKGYQDLLDEYQASKEQREESPDLIFDPDRFPAALIAACCVAPEMSLEEAKEIFDGWNAAEANALFQAAWNVCNTRQTPYYGDRIWADPLFRMEMQFCVDNGIPHSIFLGRPTPRPGEPLWLEEDRDKVVDFLAAKAEVCSSCGTRESEWKDDPEAYLADLMRCLGCEALEMIYGDIPKDQKGVKPFLRKPRAEDFEGGIIVPFIAQQPSELEVLSRESLL